MNDQETMKAGESQVVKDRSGFAGELYQVNQSFCGEVPSMKETQRWIKDMVSLLFPIRENQSVGIAEIESRLGLMKLRLEKLLAPIGKELINPPKEITAFFFTELPAVYRMLLEDAHTFLKSDPAAEKLEEVILCYPGFFSLVVHRIAHTLYNLKVPLLPRVISEYAHGKTGIDIHPGAVLGKNCFIDHGTGIVIGETTLVGDHVKIYQGVTLGALFVEKNMATTKRHPTIGDNVIIYAGATILGGKTIIGHDTIIGGNVWLTESVVPHSIVFRQNKSIIRDSKAVDKLNNFVI